MTTEDEKRLLVILDAHGQQFLSSFNIPVTSQRESDPESLESDEEWTGVGSPSNRDIFETSSVNERDSGMQSTIQASIEPRKNFICSEQEDDDFTASSSRKPDILIFSESARKESKVDLSAKQLRKSFMSSKVSNIAASSTQPISDEKLPDGESDDERTNSQNDALLHHLVHTKLLSGSLNPDLSLNHAQRGRAMAGRVLELAGKAKIGKGESLVRHEQRNKAAKRVRDGLIRKQQEEDQKGLEEAKKLGNYHPTLKRFYDSNLPSTPKKKRARGLAMGVGRFAGGTLKLSRKEIASVTGSGKRLRGDDRRQRSR